LESSSNPPFRFPTYVMSLHQIILSFLVIGARAGFSVRMLKPSARSRASLVALLFGAGNLASAQVTVTTDPVGFTTTTLLGSSDTFVSIPFTRPPEFIGGIASASGSTITLVGNPLRQSQFLYGGAQHNHYYALIGPISGTGTKEGHTYPITDNGSGTLIVDTSHDDLNNIPANTQVEVIPYWTPATIFPATDANISFTPTISSSSYQTQIRVPNYSASGINLPYSPIYFFSNNVDGTSNNVGWRNVSDNITDHGDDPLLPDGYFVVRRNSSEAQTLPLRLTNIGTVLLKKLAVPVIAISQQQDNPVSIVRPVNVALDATGLGPANHSFGAGDKLLLYNNTVAGFNKSPSATYTYDTHWRLTGDGTLSDRGADLIPSGTGFIIRKAASGVSAFWTNAFPVSAVSAVSRKVHGGGVGNLDIPLPLGGPPGIECRNGGITEIIFTFPAAVAVNAALGIQGAQLTSGIGNVSNVSGTGTNTVTVTLTGVTNAQWITLTLFGVSDGTYANDVAVRAGVLLGDVDASKRSDARDVTDVRKHTVSIPNDSATCRFDVNLSGRTDSGDVTVTKKATVTILPPSP
jgi:uncharacterized protein (TIGR02597 family)